MSLSTLLLYSISRAIRGRGVLFAPTRKNFPLSLRAITGFLGKSRREERDQGMYAAVRHAHTDAVCTTQPNPTGPFFLFLRFFSFCHVFFFRCAPCAHTHVLRENLRLRTTVQPAAELGEEMLPMTLADASEEESKVQFSHTQSEEGVLVFGSATQLLWRANRLAPGIGYSLRPAITGGSRENRQTERLHHLTLSSQLSRRLPSRARLLLFLFEFSKAFCGSFVRSREKINSLIDRQAPALPFPAPSPCCRLSCLVCGVWCTRMFRFVVVGWWPGLSGGKS